MNYYELLEIAENASREVIKAAYKAQVAKYHPDNVKSGNLEKMQELNVAFEILSDPVRRKEYDKKIKSQNDTDERKQENQEKQPQEVKMQEAWERYGMEESIAKPNKLKWYLSVPAIFVGLCLCTIPGVVLFVMRCFVLCKNKDLHHRKRKILNTGLMILVTAVLIFLGSTPSGTDDNAVESNTSQVSSVDVTTETEHPDAESASVKMSNKIEEQTSEIPEGEEDNQIGEKNLQTVIIGIEYEGGLFPSPSDAKEITIYLDDVKLGVLNQGEVINYEVSLEAGKHEIKTTRVWLDRDKLKFNVADTKDTMYPETYIGFHYKYHSLSSNGELKESSEFPRAYDENYYFVGALENQDGSSTIENTPVELSGLLEAEMTAQEIAGKIQSDYGTPMHFSEEEQGYEDSAGEVIVIDDGNGATGIMLMNTKKPSYSLRGIWCGMPLSDAYNHLLSQNDGTAIAVDDMDEFDYTFDFGGDLLGIVSGHSKVRAVLLMTNAFQEGDLSDGDGDMEENDSEYILPYSSESYYTEVDLEGFSENECRIARNEIYARHGRIFDDDKLQDYFEACSWYEPRVFGKEFSDSVLNDAERHNLDVIIQYEKTMGYR